MGQYGIQLMVLVGLVLTPPFVNYKNKVRLKKPYFLQQFFFKKKTYYII